MNRLEGDVQTMCYGWCNSFVKYGSEADSWIARPALLLYVIISFSMVLELYCYSISDINK